MTKKLSVKNICKSFETLNGKTEVLKNISFELDEGSFTVIAGENGAGKSLLMSIIAGLEECDKGNVETFGKIGMVFQEAETQILGETPAEDIAFGPKNLGWSSEKVASAVAEALEKTGLSDKKDSPARFLSGGEKRRLAVACMLAMDLPVIILDEPYANLDYSGVKQVNSLLKELKKNGKTIIVLTHEIEKCLGLAERFIVLFKGEKVFDAVPTEVMRQETDLEKWNIRNPFNSYSSLEDLIW